MDRIIKIAVYSEESETALDLKKKISQKLYCLGMHEKYSCYAYWDDVTLVKDIQNVRLSLIFLRVRSENDKGFMIAEEIEKKRIKAAYVFISSTDKLVFKALTYFPYYFLRDRKIDEELPLILDRHISRHKISKYQFPVFKYKVNGNIFRIDLDEIIYLSYHLHKITVVLLNDKKVEFRGRILDCEAQLLESCFFKANAGTIINLQHCKSLTGNIFTMCNNDKIVVSRNRKKSAEERFLKIYS